MGILLQIIIITFISGVIGTGLGGAFGAIINKNSQKIVSVFLSFAAGVMLSIVCFDLLLDAINDNVGEKSVSIFIIIIAVLFGYGIVFILNNIIDKHADKEVQKEENHPKTADDLGELIHSKHYYEHKKKNSGLFTAGIVLACAIALHNLPEGIVIGASYAKEPANLLAGSGFIMAIVIGLHNIPEGMAVSVPLISGGSSKVRAIFISACSGIPTIIGAVIGYLVGTVSELLLVLSLSFASGAMLYVVFGELLPEGFLMCKSKLPGFAAVLGMMIGLIIIYA